MSTSEGKLSMSAVRLSMVLAMLAATDLALGFFAQAYLLKVFGPGVETDAYFGAQAVPQFLMALLISPLPNVVVPLLAGASEEDRGSSAFTLWISVTATFGAVLVLAAATAPLWLPLIAPGLPPAGITIGITVVRLHLLSILFTASFNLLVCVCQASHAFRIAETAPLLGSVMMVALLPWSIRHFGIIGPAWLTVGRMILPHFLLIPAARPLLRFRWDMKLFPEAARRLGPLVFGSTLLRFEPVVERYLSSLAPTGGLSLFYLGQQIFTGVYTIVVRAVAVPVVPPLAAHASARRYGLFDGVLRRATVALLVILTGAMLAFAVVGRPALGILLSFSATGAGRAGELYVIMLGLGGTLIGGALGQLFASSLYALADTKTPTVLGLFTSVLGIGLRILGFRTAGLFGLALGASVQYVVAATLLFGATRWVRRRRTAS